MWLRMSDLHLKKQSNDILNGNRQPSVVQAVKQVEKIHQGQTVQTRGLLNLLETILKGTDFPLRSYRKRVIKLYAYVTEIAKLCKLKYVLSAAYHIIVGY